MHTTTATLTDPSGKRFVMRYEQPRQTGNFGERFMYIFPEQLTALARRPGLHNDAMRVLVFAWDRLDFENFKQISQAAWARELGQMSQSTVGRCMGQLLELGHLERRGAGPRQEWRLNPVAAWRGSANRFHAVCRERGLEERRLPKRAGEVELGVIDGGGDDAA